MIHTSDLDALFFPKLDVLADELGARAKDLLAVIFSESGCRADAWNDNPKNLPPEQRWNASGLIQFMPATLKGLGWAKGHAEFRRLSATAQLDWVRRYYAPHRGHLASVGGLYVATFLPALIRHAGDPAFVLTAKNGPLGWAYAPNASFDANRDYAITVGELEAAVRRNARGPRWAEIIARLEGLEVAEAPVTDDEAVDLGTTLGLQRALDRLGFETGVLDGIPGPRTRNAIAAFQREHQLTPDGIFGPLSRTMMERLLRILA